MNIQNLAIATAFVSTIFITGCASTLLSDDKISSNTAGVIGVPRDAITITDRREDGLNTFYTATVRAAKKVTQYACTINGGTVLSFGMVNTPTCTKK